MQISGELNKSQLNHLRSEIERLNLTPDKRRRLIYRILKNGVLAATNRNIRRQRTPEGAKFDKRQSRRKSKLLSKITKNIVIKSSSNEGRAYFRGVYRSTSTKTIPVGVVANTQQRGLQVTQNKNQFGNQTQDSNTGSITERQIRRLRKLGHTHSTGKKRVRSSVRWLRANLSEAQAGITIHNMLKSPEKNSWNIKIPAREFLGISENDFMKTAKRELRSINYGGKK